MISLLLIRLILEDSGNETVVEMARSLFGRAARNGAKHAVPEHKVDREIVLGVVKQVRAQRRGAQYVAKEHKADREIVLEEVAKKNRPKQRAKNRAAAAAAAAVAERAAFVSPHLDPCAVEMKGIKDLLNVAVTLKRKGKWKKTKRGKKRTRGKKKAMSTRLDSSKRHRSTRWIVGSCSQP